ncbi:unnamed protein product [Tilletia controversa]|nr:unnamed protein product [Tilletia controversa]
MNIPSSTRPPASSPHKPPCNASPIAWNLRTEDLSFAMAEIDLLNWRVRDKDSGPIVIPIREGAAEKGITRAGGLAAAAAEQAMNPCIGPPVDDPLGFRLRGYRLLPAPPTSSGQWPMSAYPEFELLPPPPPTFLSTSSPRRAQLPRFANVDEVVQFARGQVLARRDPMIERSLFFVVIYIGLLVGLAASVIIRRIINRNFWLFRIVRRPDGLLLVPHLHNCWSFMAGSFGFVFTVYNGISLANLLRHQY